MGFMFRMESVASPKTCEDAAWELVAISNRLNTGVISNVGGSEMMALPNETTKIVYDRWRYLRDSATAADDRRQTIQKLKHAFNQLRPTASGSSARTEVDDYLRALIPGWDET